MGVGLCSLHALVRTHRHTHSHTHIHTYTQTPAQTHVHRGQSDKEAVIHFSSLWRKQLPTPLRLVLVVLVIQRLPPGPLRAPVVSTSVSLTEIFPMFLATLQWLNSDLQDLNWNRTKEELELVLPGSAGVTS